jgi:hypothetical protein
VTPPEAPGTEAGTGEEPVGTLAEEAAKLLGALSGWADRGDQGGPGGRVDDLASRASDALHQVAAHASASHASGATGAGECTWCPLCRTVHAVRSLSPEVREHLASAATSLVHAAAGLLATAVPDQEDDREKPA